MTRFLRILKAKSYSCSHSIHVVLFCHSAVAQSDAFSNAFPDLNNKYTSCQEIMSQTSTREQIYDHSYPDWSCRGVGDIGVRMWTQMLVTGLSLTHLKGNLTTIRARSGEGKVIALKWNAIQSTIVRSEA